MGEGRGSLAEQRQGTDTLREDRAAWAGALGKNINALGELQAFP